MLIDCVWSLLDTLSTAKKKRTVVPSKIKSAATILQTTGRDNHPIDTRASGALHDLHKVV